MKILFWLSLVGVLYTYAGYPLIMWMLASVWPRPWTIAPITPSVSVVVAVEKESVSLHVNDDGVGISSDGRRSGLTNLIERANLLGGTCTATRHDASGGTDLTWSVPLSTL